MLSFRFHFRYLVVVSLTLMILIPKTACAFPLSRKASNCVSLIKKLTSKSENLGTKRQIESESSLSSKLILDVEFSLMSKSEKSKTLLDMYTDPDQQEDVISYFITLLNFAQETNLLSEKDKTLLVEKLKLSFDKSKKNIVIPNFFNEEQKKILLISLKDVKSSGDYSDSNPVGLLFNSRNINIRLFQEKIRIFVKRHQIPLEFQDRLFYISKVLHFSYEDINKLFYQLESLSFIKEFDRNGLLRLLAYLEFTSFQKSYKKRQILIKEFPLIINHKYSWPKSGIKKYLPNVFNLYNANSPNLSPITIKFLKTEKKFRKFEFKRFREFNSQIKYFKDNDKFSKKYLRSLKKSDFSKQDSWYQNMKNDILDNRVDLDNQKNIKKFMRMHANIERKQFENLFFGCRSSRVNSVNATGGKLFRNIAMGISSVSSAYFYHNTHKDEDKDHQWYQKFGYELTMGVFMGYVTAKIFSNPATSFWGKVITKYMIAFLPSTVDAVVYSHIFTSNPELSVKKYNEIMNDPEFKKRLVKLDELMEKKSFVKNFWAQIDKTMIDNGFSDINLRNEQVLKLSELSKDQLKQDLYKDLLFNAFDKEEYYSKERVIETGNIGLDRFAFYRLWGIPFTFKSVAVGVNSALAVCMLQNNPALSVFVGSVIFMVNKMMTAPIHYPLREMIVDGEESEESKKIKIERKRRIEDHLREASYKFLNNFMGIDFVGKYENTENNFIVPYQLN